MDMFSQILWAALPSLLTGIILSVWNSRQKRREIVRDEKEADRRKSEMLRISLLVATAQLSRAVAMAIKRGSRRAWNNTIWRWKNSESSRENRL